MPAFNDRQGGDIKPYSQQHILNQSFDRTNQVLVVEQVGSNGQALTIPNSDNLATKVVTSGTDTYVGFAAPGTTAATAKWQAFKVDVSGNVTYADGDASFDNTASDLASLTYS